MSYKKKDPSDALNDSDMKNFEEAWKAADIRHRENETHFLKYTIAFSSALLGFSITLISTLIKNNVFVNINKIMLGISWFLIVITIIVGILSLLISKKANGIYMDNLQRQLDNETVCPNGFDTACTVLEWVIFGLLFISVILNVGFVLYYI